MERRLAANILFHIWSCFKQYVPRYKTKQYGSSKLKFKLPTYVDLEMPREVITPEINLTDTFGKISVNFSHSWSEFQETSSNHMILSREAAWLI